VIEVSGDCPANRDEIISALHAENILARKYFWPGCHGMLPYRELFPHAGLMLQHTEDVSQRVIVLPNGTSLDDHEIITVCQTIRTLVQSTKKVKHEH
jgi:dTDP-4-amino-4,6-dideoxygalactose transaminase